MRIKMVTAAVTLSIVCGGGVAHAEAQTEIPVNDLSSVSGLSADQLEAIRSFVEGEPASVEAVPQPPVPASQFSAMASSTASRRATYYRGSFLMWTRDSVDFRYNWSKVVSTSAYQTSGRVIPNIARNKGITKYHDTKKNDRFRAVNEIGAGIETPWGGSITLYTQQFVHRLSVHHNGAWSAWSD